MATNEMEYQPSPDLSMGVELELQILNSRDYNLARDAADLLKVLEKVEYPGEIKPEITESMIELNSSIHVRYETLVTELKQIRDVLVEAAGRLNLKIAGGGSHPFHKWSDRRIYPTERFKYLLDVYGYLAKQFTVFGQHIHIGCPNGDEALYLTHILSRYIPHFIALSASSPFQQGTDTGYQSSRLNTVSAFPLAGNIPFVTTWGEFIAYYEKMRGFHIVESMKDFYWDIRPKPEFGTVEIRVLDTPLTVEHAARLAAYAQTLAHYIFAKRSLSPSPDVYLVYKHNRFQACRYGLGATYVNAYTQQQVPLQCDILDTLDLLRPHAVELGTSEALDTLRADTEASRSDAQWLRQAHDELGSLNDVARRQSEQWIGRNGSTPPRPA